VRAQTAELGRQSLESLARAIAEPGSVRRGSHKLATQLVIRASCTRAVRRVNDAITASVRRV
jgi:hypothetical protein